MHIKIYSIKEKPELSYLKSFEILYQTRSGRQSVWELVSRKGLERLEDEIYNGGRYSDGTMIFAVDENKSQVAMLKEYRVSAGRFVYTLPAGLGDAGETVEETAVREFKEETGMDFSPLWADRSRYVSVGLTNECVTAVYGYYSGVPSTAFLTDEEEAEVVFVDRDRAKVLLASEEVTARSAYLIQGFFKLNPFFE